MSKSKKKKGFCCRVCGGLRYKKLFDTSFSMSDPVEAEPSVVGYTCVSCSVTFQNPKKFSLKEGERESPSSIHDRLGLPEGGGKLR